MSKFDRDARFIWSPDGLDHSYRVSWVAFNLDFELEQTVVHADLHLFAESRYRLWVNDDIIGHGPARFVFGTETFDTFSLTPWLKSGKNNIQVEVCGCQVNSYQSMANGRGRFIAWGCVTEPNGRTSRLETPGHWRVRRLKSRDDRTPAFSFAIGPAESLDHRVISSELKDRQGWDQPAVIEMPRTLTPRDLPSPTGQWIAPDAAYLMRLQDAESRIGDASIDLPWDHAGGTDRPQRVFRYAAFMHSPRSQKLTLGLHWGPHFFNGQPIRATDDPVRGNRQNAVVDFNRGWNLLAGEPVQLRPTQQLLIAWPADAGVSAHATPDRGDPHTLRLLPPVQIEAGTSWVDRPPRTADDLDLESNAWRLIHRGQPPTSPAQAVSWDVPETSGRKPIDGWPCLIDATEQLTLMLHFERRYFGYIQIKIDAPAETLIELAYDERLRSDGVTALFATNHLIASADRFICSEGLQRLETFHPRSGHYLQLTIRPPADANRDIEIGRIAVRDARCLSPVSGRFSCDDRELSWAWDHGLQTLQDGTEDVFTDSPWRERGLYLGDSYVQSATHIVGSDDHRPIRRALHLFAQGQRADGQLPGVVPAWLRKPHGDFTLLYGHWLHEYWVNTGDLSVVEECLPAVDRLLESSTWQTSKYSMLWNATDENRLFIDWGVRRPCRHYDENTALNALRFRSLQSAATMHRALGRPEIASVLRDQAERIKFEMQDRLWEPAAGRFASGTADGRRIHEESLHPNILALAFDIASEYQKPTLIDFVTRRLANNASHACRGVPGDDFAELYFLKFALLALSEINRFDLAEQIIRDHVRPMIKSGSWTYWECLHRGVNRLGSLCHGWSTTPVEYLTRYVLGVRVAEPGAPHRILIDPRTFSIESAGGVYPHPLGPITVEWEMGTDGVRQIKAQGPPGVDLHIVEDRHETEPGVPGREARGPSSRPST